MVPQDGRPLPATLPCIGRANGGRSAGTGSCFANAKTGIPRDPQNWSIFFEAEQANGNAQIIPTCFNAVDGVAISIYDATTLTSPLD